MLIIASSVAEMTKLVAALKAYDAGPALPGASGKGKGSDFATFG